MYTTRWLLISLFTLFSLVGMHEEALVFPKAPDTLFWIQGEPIRIPKEKITLLAHPTVQQCWKNRPEDSAQFLTRLINTFKEKKENVTPETVWNFFKDADKKEEPYEVLFGIEKQWQCNQIAEMRQIEEMGVILATYAEELGGITRRIELPHPILESSDVIIKEVTDTVCQPIIWEFWNNYRGPNTSNASAFTRLKAKMELESAGDNSTKMWGVLLRESFIYRDSVRNRMPSRFQLFADLNDIDCSLQMMCNEALTVLTVPKDCSLESVNFSLKPDGSFDLPQPNFFDNSPERSSSEIACNSQDSDLLGGIFDNRNLKRARLNFSQEST